MDNLIQDLRDLAECVELGEWEVPIGLYDALQAAADELEKRRWIPVEERLPDEDCKTLVCTKNRSIITSRFSAYNKTWDAPGKSATHWMSLPEGPEEKSKEGKV